MKCLQPVKVSSTAGQQHCHLTLPVRDCDRDEPNGCRDRTGLRIVSRAVLDWLDTGSASSRSLYWESTVSPGLTSSLSGATTVTNAAQHRREVYFVGHVQGVGFRHSAQQLAKDFEVTGYVKNLVDGRVQVVVEGDAKEVDRFIGALQTEMAQYIDAAQTSGAPATGEFSDFSVRM